MFENVTVFIITQTHKNNTYAVLISKLNTLDLFQKVYKLELNAIFPKLSYLW